MSDPTPMTDPGVASEPSRVTITSGHLNDGLWQVRVDPVGDVTHEPDLTVLCQGRVVPDVTMDTDGGGWLVRIPLPSSVLSDGVHTIVIAEAASGVVLQSLHIAAGAVLDEDLRAEISLLRAELDLMKRAVRRHCADPS